MLFGGTGDLARKMIYPALYAMAESGTLQVPVIAVALSAWNLEQLREYAEDAVRQSGPVGARTRGIPVRIFRRFLRRTEKPNRRHTRCTRWRLIRCPWHRKNAQANRYP